MRTKQQYPELVLRKLGFCAFNVGLARTPSELRSEELLKRRPQQLWQRQNRSSIRIPKVPMGILFDIHKFQSM